VDVVWSLSGGGVSVVVGLVDSRLDDAVVGAGVDVTIQNGTCVQRYAVVPHTVVREKFLSAGYGH
jgi:hypothetical protein